MGYRWIKDGNQRRFVSDEEYKKINQDDASSAWLGIKFIVLLILLIIVARSIFHSFGGWALLGTSALVGYLSYKYFKILVWINELIDKLMLGIAIFIGVAIVVVVGGSIIYAIITQLIMK